MLAISANRKKVDLELENGYIIWEQNWCGDVVRLQFDMEPKRMYCTARGENEMRVYVPGTTDICEK